MTLLWPAGAGRPALEDHMHDLLRDLSILQGQVAAAVCDA